MYFFFIKEVSPEIKYSDQPRAIDPAQYTMLAAKRDSVQSVSPLLFQCGPVCLEQDYLDITNVAIGKLCSQRFIDVLVQEHVVFTAYPAYLLDKYTQQMLSSSYFFWMPTWIEGAIDWERSEEEINWETGVRYLTKLVVTTKCEANMPLLFQTKEKASILIHDRLRRLMEETHLRGIDFAPLDAAYTPSQGPQKIRLEQVLQANPDDWETWCKLGYLLVSLYRYQDALHAFDQALALKADLKEAWYRRGKVLHLLGNNAEALKALSKVLEGDLQAEALQEYCTILREMKCYEEALTYAQRLIQLRNTSPSSWYALSEVYKGLHFYQEALDAINTCVALGGGLRSAQAYQLKGDLHVQFQQYKEALDAYTKGLLVSPIHRGLWAGKAKMFYALGQPEEAETAQKKLQELEIQREKNLRRGVP